MQVHLQGARSLRLLAVGWPQRTSPALQSCVWCVRAALPLSGAGAGCSRRRNARSPEPDAPQRRAPAHGELPESAAPPKGRSG